MDECCKNCEYSATFDNELYCCDSIVKMFIDGIEGCIRTAHGKRVSPDSSCNKIILKKDNS